MHCSSFKCGLPIMSECHVCISYIMFTPSTSRDLLAVFWLRSWITRFESNIYEFSKQMFSTVYFNWLYAVHTWIIWNHIANLMHVIHVSLYLGQFLRRISSECCEYLSHYWIWNSQQWFTFIHTQHLNSSTVNRQSWMLCTEFPTVSLFGSRVGTSYAS